MPPRTGTLSEAVVTIGATELAGRRARRAARSRTWEWLARLGLVCRGLLYLLIGWLALQISFGNESGEADTHGAIGAIAERSFGAALLWLMMVGFAALGLVQLVEAILGSGDAKVRLIAASRFVLYGLLTSSLANLLLTGDRGDSSNQQARDLTVWAMQLPLGRVLVGVIALVIIGAAGYWIYKGVTRKFLEDFHTERMSRRAWSVVKPLGTVGLPIRGVVAALLGVFLGQAAMTFDPDDAKGVDATLRTFADTAVGPWLLTAVAVGVLVFAA
jgi:hypothetical protein